MLKGRRTMHPFRYPHPLTRRALLAKSSALVGCMAAWPATSGLGQSGKAEFVEVKSACGRLRGVAQNGITTFKGVPYAGSVSGPNRFKAARPTQPWTGVRDALRFGAPAVQQAERPSIGTSEPMPGEDCLFLNVWTPATDGRKRPVMFYSHGGGFTTGSAGALYQDGGKLAYTWDVVVVATNHRLGLFGFLYLAELSKEYATSGNQGLLDICDGLKWVRENIESFGGDPENVMIFGESGGGAKTSCLYAMPAAEPYFNKASIESGPGIRMMPRDAAAETTLMVLKQLGLDKSQWRKLLELPTDRLLAVQVELAKNPGRGPLTMTGGRKGIGGGVLPGGFGPVVEGTVLPHDPFDPEAPAISKSKPLMVGYNRDETAFFFMQFHDTDVFNLTDAGLKARLQKEFGDKAPLVLETYRESRPAASPADLYIAITTARMIGLGSITIAERKYGQRGAPVYMYIFMHESDVIVPGTQHKLGAAHALEIPYKFDNIAKPQESPMPMDIMSDSRPSSAKTGFNMSEMWSTFARTGHPGAKGQPYWPPYDTQQRATMEIDAECKVVDDPFSLERRLWEKLDA
jgi:para-nitrobenzyl esterase